MNSALSVTGTHVTSNQMVTHFGALNKSTNSVKSFTVAIRRTY